MVWFLFSLLLIGLVTWIVWQVKFRKISVKKTDVGSKYLNLHNYKIHYLQTGSGPHLVLLHGIGASTFAWRFLLKDLSEHYTVTAIDLLGFGQSDKPHNFSYNLDDQSALLLQILDQLDIKQAFLVGSSMGGALALWLGQLYPDRFNKVVTLAPAIDPKVAILDLHNLSFLSPLFLPIVTPLLVKTIMKRVITNPRVINHESIHSYYEPYSVGKNGIRAFVKSFALLRDERLPVGLKNYHGKHLMIWGKADRIVPYNVGERLEKLLQNTKLVIHPTAGHHPMEDDPKWVVEHLLEFFR